MLQIFFQQKNKANFYKFVTKKRMLHHFLKSLESNPIQLQRVTPLYSLDLQDMHTVQNDFLIIDVICCMKYQLKTYIGIAVYYIIDYFVFAWNLLVTFGAVSNTDAVFKKTGKCYISKSQRSNKIAQYIKASNAHRFCAWLMYSVTQSSSLCYAITLSKLYVAIDISIAEWGNQAQL